MSMISAQIDELRKMADGQATYRDAREVMLKAADTIIELHGALQVASVDYRHLEVENAKLRELLRAAYNCTNAGPNCLECRIVAGGCTLLSAMRELGIEVDG